MEETKKPNGVLFKVDANQLVLVLRKENKFDWDNMLHFKMDEISDKHADLSCENPFDFVFAICSDNSFTTMNSKSSIPNKSFLQLANENKLISTIEKDYELQYEYQIFHN
jgi:hypothetical protein